MVAPAGGSEVDRPGGSGGHPPGVAAIRIVGQGAVLLGAVQGAPVGTSRPPNRREGGRRHDSSRLIVEVDRGIGLVEACRWNRQIAVLDLVGDVHLVRADRRVGGEICHHPSPDADAPPGLVAHVVGAAQVDREADVPVRLQVHGDVLDVGHPGGHVTTAAGIDQRLQVGHDGGLSAGRRLRFHRGGAAVHPARTQPLPTGRVPGRPPLGGVEELHHLLPRRLRRSILRRRPHRKRGRHHQHHQQQLGSMSHLPLLSPSPPNETGNPSA